jgi:hypothetical protein
MYIRGPCKCSSAFLFARARAERQAAVSAGDGGERQSAAVRWISALSRK